MGFQQKLHKIIGGGDMPARDVRQTIFLSTPLCSNAEEVLGLSEVLLKPDFVTVSSDASLVISPNVTQVVIKAPGEIAERVQLLLAILSADLSSRLLVCSY